MEDVRDTQPTINIRVVGPSGIVPAAIGVFIDGQNVGVLKDKNGQSFPVAPGVRKVMAMVNSMDSETWDLDMSSGNLAALECGFQHSVALSILPMLMAMMIPSQLGFHLLSVVIGIGVVPLMIGRFWRLITTRGNLYLRPQSALLVPGTRTPPVMRKPQMTIWKGMIVVAVIAVMLAVVVQDRIMRRRLAYESLRHRYQFLADLYAKDEIIQKSGDPDMARLEKAASQSVALLSEAVNSKPGDLDLKKKFEKEQQDLEVIRAYMANRARKTDYYARLKEKYLRAASHPWEAVDADPPPPP